MTRALTNIRTAPKDYRCAWCEHTIHEGQQYSRRNESNGIHFKANKYHPECADAKVSDDLARKENT